jgi:hypothetical protein
VRRYTYGIAGFFWLHDSYYITGEGTGAWRSKPVMFVLSALTIFAGAFICVAGTYVTITLIVNAYNSGGEFPFLSGGRREPDFL